MHSPPAPPLFQCCGELCSSTCEIYSAKRLTRLKASKKKTTLKLGGGGGRKEGFRKDGHNKTQSKNKLLFRFTCEINSVTSRFGTVFSTQLRMRVYMSMSLWSSVFHASLDTCSFSVVGALFCKPVTAQGFGLTSLAFCGGGLVTKACCC